VRAFFYLFEFCLFLELHVDLEKAVSFNSIGADLSVAIQSLQFLATNHFYQPIWLGTICDTTVFRLGSLDKLASFV
jgi:hypothetical protein